MRKSRPLIDARSLLPILASALALAGLAACGPLAPARPAAPGAKAEATAGEAAYRRPPEALGASAQGGGRVEIFGLADPGARVRLASPSGQAAFVQADLTGRWRATTSDAAGVRLVGLSMADGPRMVQAQSYLALLPGAHVVQLRSGAGAVALGPAQGLALSALDYDRKGGAVISGLAPPHGAVDITMDGVPLGRAPADGEGRFSLDLDAPLRPGAHWVKVAAGGVSVAVQAEVTAPPPLSSGPFAASRMADGWRIVWITPGGGVQTTLLFDRAGAAA